MTMDGRVGEREGEQRPHPPLPPLSQGGLSRSRLLRSFSEGGGLMLNPSPKGSSAIIGGPTSSSGSSAWQIDTRFAVEVVEVIVLSHGRTFASSFITQHEGYP